MLADAAVQHGRAPGRGLHLFQQGRHAGATGAVGDVHRRQAGIGQDGADHLVGRAARHVDAATAAGLRGRGVSVEALYVHLLAPAARHLGELWEDDRCHFADVTVGMAGCSRSCAA